MKRGNNNPITWYINEEIGGMSPAAESTEKNLTGSWRYLTPHHRQRPAPCESACPLSVPVPDFINELDKGTTDSAARLIRLENPLPRICGRVCSRQCEGSCSRGEFDMPVSIRALERFTGDSSSSGIPNLLPLPGNRKFSVAVVGGGPAGIAISYFLLLLGYSVTIYEKSSRIGGVLRSGIPEYRLPPGVLDKALEPLLSMKPEVKTGAAFGTDVKMKDLENYDALFFGTGAPIHWNIKNIKGEDSILSGLSLLEKIRSGDRSLRGKKVAVIGGGNTAIDTARSLLRTGSRVVVVYRRGVDDMKAFPGEIREAVSEGAEIITGTVVKELVLDNGKVKGVKCVEVKGEDGYRGELTDVKGTEFTIEVDGVVSAVGEKPELSLFSELYGETSESLETDMYKRTSVSGVYAGGDLSGTPHLVVNALAAGKLAAVTIDADLNLLDMEKIYSFIKTGSEGISFGKYLELRTGFIEGRYPEEQVPEPVNIDEINTAYFQKSARTGVNMLSLEERAGNFREVDTGFDIEMAGREVSRCFHCGRCAMCGNCILFCPDISTSAKSDNTGIDIDYDYCKGCGICAEECPAGFIDMKRDRTK